MCTVGNFIHKKFVFWFHPYILQHRELTFYTNNVPYRAVYEWMLGKLIHSAFRPIASFNSFHTFSFTKPQEQSALQRCFYLLDYSVPGGKSLYLHVYSLIQNFNNFNLTFEISDVLSCLIASHLISEFVENICAYPVYYIVKCFSDYRRGFGLDDLIYCTLYIRTTRDYR
jgi:hypothetical protein